MTGTLAIVGLGPGEGEVGPREREQGVLGRRELRAQARGRRVVTSRGGRVVGRRGVGCGDVGFQRSSSGRGGQSSGGPAA